MSLLPAEEPFLFVFSTQGNALIEVGESMKLMAEVKDSLDINVKQTFIDPLQLLQDKDLREIGVSLLGYKSTCYYFKMISIWKVIRPFL